MKGSIYEHEGQYWVNYESIDYGPYDDEDEANQALDLMLAQDEEE